MIDFEEVFSEIKDFFSDRTKRIVVICSLLIFMTLCAVIILISEGNNSTSKKTAQKIQRTLDLEKELLIPTGPEVPDEYVTSRKTKEAWSDEDCEKWFTVPGKTEIKNLRTSNSKMADDILGAAP